MNIYKFASNCIITKGIIRSTIIDLQKDKIYYISNNLADFLGKNFFHKSEVPSNYKPIIDKMVAEQILLIINEDDLTLFPQASTTFESPCYINDIIIEFKNIYHKFDKIVPQLEKLLCKNIEIRFYENSFNADYLQSIANLIENSIIECVEIYIPYDLYIKYRDETQKILKENIRLKTAYIHSVDGEIFKDDSKCFFTYQIINSNKHCGKINEFNFNINSLTYLESLSHNTCLNKKISIDSEGEIKNCPSMLKSYGNIENTSLMSTLQIKEFKKYWDIKKEDVKECNNCEFRSICTDCRAYLEDPKDLYSKPLKCGYNILTGEWQNWSENPLKTNAIKYYSLTEN